MPPILRFLLLPLICIIYLNAHSNENVHVIDDRLELFVDKELISEMHNLDLLLHSPIKQPLASSPLKKTPFATIIKLKNKYIAYYRTNNPKYRGVVHKTGYPDKLIKYAFSKDGINWTNPKKNIIIKEPPFTHNFSPFLDKNPNAKNHEKFKALAGVDDNLLKRLKSSPPRSFNNKTLEDTLKYWGYPENYQSGLYSFASNDGIHWIRKSKIPVITVDKNVKAFDSQNVSFWSQAEQSYVCFFRTWAKTKTIQRPKLHWVRKISKVTSRDFIHWSEPITIDTKIEGEQLYTSQTQPYYRAPHIYIALPTRFISQKKGKGLTDIMFMSMRSGNKHYDRTFKEAYIKPGKDINRWKNRANFIALNVVETSKNELSIYHSKSQHRYTLRLDGFSSIHAGHKEGELLTKPLIFKGKNLYLNYASSAAGHLNMEILDINGSPIKGFTKDDSNTLIGDKIKQKVIWKKNKNFIQLEGNPIRLKFILKECDLYSFKFE